MARSPPPVYSDRVGDDLAGRRPSTTADCVHHLDPIAGVQARGRVLTAGNHIEVELYCEAFTSQPQRIDQLSQSAAIGGLMWLPIECYIHQWR